MKTLILVLGLATTLTACGPQVPQAPASTQVKDYNLSNPADQLALLKAISDEQGWTNRQSYLPGRTGYAPFRWYGR